MMYPVCIVIYALYTTHVCVLRTMSCATFKHEQGELRNVERCALLAGWVILCCGCDSLHYCCVYYYY